MSLGTIYLLGNDLDKAQELAPIARIAALFLHPTLQSLTIARAYVDLSTDMPWFLHDPMNARSTPLASLTLEQCNMSESGLATLLSIPRALKSLDVREADRYGPRRYPFLSAAALAAALTPQKDCLESLSLEHAPQGNHPVDLSEYPALRHIEFGGAFTRQLLSESPDFGRFSPVFPPRLASLKFGQAYYQFRVEGRHIRPYIRHLLAQKDKHVLS